MQHELNCGSTDKSSARGLGDSSLSTQTANPRAKTPLELLPSSAHRQNTTHRQAASTGPGRRDAEQKADSTPLENGGLLFLLPLASQARVGEESSLAAPVLAEACTQAGQWALSCPSPCCSRQQPPLPIPGPLLPSTEAQRVSLPGDSQALPPGRGGGCGKAALSDCGAARVRESLTTGF